MRAYHSEPLTPLFEPFEAGKLRLRNRLVMAPMTREFSPANTLPLEAVTYYERRAQGGVGMIISEGAAVPHVTATESARVPTFPGNAPERWRAVCVAVQAAGCAMLVQLWHAGLARKAATTVVPNARSWAPSQVGPEPLHVMSESDIADVIAAFATAGAAARALGFNGLAVHGAHGYLIDEFFWRSTNRRSDRYGGELRARTRFAAELVAALRRATAPDFPIVFRFSQWKGGRYDYKIATTPDELEQWLQPLVDAGVDVFDASTRRFWEPEFAGSALNLAGWAKKLTGRPTLMVGSVGLQTPLEAGDIAGMPASSVSSERLDLIAGMLDRSEVDLVALGRMLLTNPEWPLLVEKGRFERILPYDPVSVAQRLECAASPASASN